MDDGPQYIIGPALHLLAFMAHAGGIIAGNTLKVKEHRGVLCQAGHFVIQWAPMEADEKTIKGVPGPVCVAATVLAAGSSERMGQLKQLLPVEGQPMVRRVTETVCASGLAQVIVVVGAHAEKVEAALAGLPVEVVRNRAWREGMSTSLCTGIGAVRPEIAAVLVVLADQPAVTSGLLQELVERYRATQAAIVAPFYRGRRGNPVLFDRSLFPMLLAVRGDRGAREIIEQHAKQIERVACDDPAVVQDVDTLEDFEAATRSARRGRDPRATD